MDFLDGNARGPGWRLKALLLICAAIAFGSMFQPSTWVRGAVLDWLGNPKYTGFIGVTIPHMFLYTTIPAAVSALMWWLLWRRGAMPPLALRAGRRTWGEAAIGALGSIIVLSAAAMLAGAHPAWRGIDGWSVVGNLFSNFYEELVFRGFIFTALGVTIGVWPAMLASSLLWGVSHDQYPWLLQGAIACTGVLYCWIQVRARSLLAPYGAHMIMDIVLDSVLG